jgi:hypothetical protein
VLSHIKQGENGVSPLQDSHSSLHCVSWLPKETNIDHVLIDNRDRWNALGDWDGQGYLLRGLCIDGEEVTHYFHPTWDVEQSDGSMISVPFPHAFRHNLSTIMNTMIDDGLVFLRLTEWTYDDEPPVPGSWAHCTHCVHPEFHSYWRIGSTIPPTAE